MNMNVRWTPAPSGDNKVSRQIRVNVSESGIIKPGSYSVETRGNIIYWPIKGER